MVTKPKPLWKAEDQQTRLSELTAASDQPAKDNPLRRDVRSLGAILGQTLAGGAPLGANPAQSRPAQAQPQPPR